MDFHSQGAATSIGIALKNDPTFVVLIEMLPVFFYDNGVFLQNEPILK